jgi:hypothetical protein
MHLSRQHWTLLQQVCSTGELLTVLCWHSKQCTVLLTGCADRLCNICSAVLLSLLVLLVSHPATATSVGPRGTPAPVTAPGSSVATPATAKIVSGGQGP